MIFLKAISFILWNMAIGMSIICLIDWLLFNRKARYIFGWRIPLTPGFLVSKREWLFNKARDLLHDYLEQAGDYARKHGYLAKWEALVRSMVFEKTSFIDEWKLLPQSIKDKLHNKLADMAKGLASGLLRKLVPQLIEQWRIEHKIDEFDEKFSIDFFYGFLKKYVHKPVIYFVLGLNLLIGLNNTIWYLILLLF